MNNVQTEVALILESGTKVLTGFFGPDYCLDSTGRHTCLPTILAGNSKDGYLCGFEDDPKRDEDGNAIFETFIFYIPVG